MTKGDFTKCASVWHILRPEISPTRQVVSDVDRNRRFPLRRLRRIGSCRISIRKALTTDVVSAFFVKGEL